MNQKNQITKPTTPNCNNANAPEIKKSRNKQQRKKKLHNHYNRTGARKHLRHQQQPSAKKHRIETFYLTEKQQKHQFLPDYAYFECKHMIFT